MSRLKFLPESRPLKVTGNQVILGFSYRLLEFEESIVAEPHDEKGEVVFVIEKNVCQNWRTSLPHFVSGSLIGAAEASGIMLNRRSPSGEMLGLDLNPSQP